MASAVHRMGQSPVQLNGVFMPRDRCSKTSLQKIYLGTIAPAPFRMLGIFSSFHRNNRPNCRQAVGEGLGHLELGSFRTVDIGVGSEVIVGMAQPLLDILHCIIQVQHDRGAAVTEVVEADGTQAVLYQNLLEFLAHEVRLEQHAHLVHADEVQVFPVIAGTAKLHLGHLPLPQPGEIIVGVLAQRQAPAAGFGLGGSVPDGADYPVADLLLDHCRLDVDPAVLEIDGGPAKAQ